MVSTTTLRRFPKDFRDPLQLLARSIRGEVLERAHRSKQCKGVLCKETHEHTLRSAPPLVITREEIDHAIDALAGALKA